MYLKYDNGLADLVDDTRLFSRAALGISLAPYDIERLQKLSDVRHARYGCLATVLGALSLSRLKAFSRGERRMVLAVGDDVQVSVSAIFAERLAESGARRVNPIMFPNTLPSAPAVALAARFEAHAGAMAIDGAHPFWEMLARADLLLRQDISDEIFLFAHGEEKNGATTALGFLASTRPFIGPSIRIDRVDRITGSTCRACKSAATLAVDLMVEVEAGKEATPQVISTADGCCSIHYTIIRAAA